MDLVGIFEVSLEVMSYVSFTWSMNSCPRDRYLSTYGTNIVIYQSSIVPKSIAIFRYEFIIHFCPKGIFHGTHWALSQGRARHTHTLSGFKSPPFEMRQHSIATANYFGHTCWATSAHHSPVLSAIAPLALAIPLVSFPARARSDLGHCSVMGDWRWPRLLLTFPLCR
ncbi:uncharacterized protein BDZ83DRAFT_176535 [Colletotrichum acutatum]|uniref:Uncharacterized protein n=1 Tax=Glomerella acutata TaxID=27357 RepID=A0AAD8XIJ6_GLOAC|nr:uncharacterized protein BDZ83DRAFT_176535 [Colletotrichum acutatum]KAK1727801.1 hypothetical protein BDZ83DRAFT_176535 [Colletotrichum acutatum]